MKKRRQSCANLPNLPIPPEKQCFRAGRAGWAGFFQVHFLFLAGRKRFQISKTRPTRPSRPALLRFSSILGRVGRVGRDNKIHFRFFM